MALTPPRRFRVRHGTVEAVRGIDIGVRDGARAAITMAAIGLLVGMCTLRRSAG